MGHSRCAEAGISPIEQCQRCFLAATACHPASAFSGSSSGSGRSRQCPDDLLQRRFCLAHWFSVVPSCLLAKMSVSTVCPYPRQSPEPQERCLGASHLPVMTMTRKGLILYDFNIWIFVLQPAVGMI